MRFIPILLVVAGLALAVAGVTLISIPAAMIAAGIGIVVLGLWIDLPEKPQ